MTSPLSWRRAVATTALLATFVAGATAAPAVAASASAAVVGRSAAPAVVADNPYQRGPAPSWASIEAARGTFAVSQSSVSRYVVSGFGGGTVYYPSDRSQGTFGAVVVAPGYTARQSSLAWLGPRIASQGFVVFTIDTITIYDQPASRGDQLLAAADYLTQRSSVADRIDAARVAVMGHSMGGGGTLEAAKDRPSLKAAIPLTPWNIDKTWPEVTTPTLIIGAQNDTVAPVATHARPFYQSLPAATPRTYLELRGATHFAPNLSNTTIAEYSIAWLKRFVDNDTRYTQFLCPAPSGTALSAVSTSCPF